MPSFKPKFYKPNKNQIQIVSFSGGRTSAYLCYLVKKMYPNNSIFIYCDTGSEHQATYDFIKKVDKEFNLNLICLKAKINHEFRKAPDFEIVNIQDLKWDLSTFKELAKKHSTPFMPNGKFCTTYLKSYPFYKYCRSNYESFNTWLGIRADEPRRIKDRTKKDYQHIRYLSDISELEKMDILEFWKNQDFDLNIDHTDILGNCVFCIEKGIKKIAIAIKKEPKLYQDWQHNFLENKENAIINNRDPKLIYRGKLDLNGIANLYQDYTIDYLIENLRKTKASGRGCGSGSCEIQENLL